MSIGENFKVLRKRLKKSQEDVSSDLGLNRSTYNGYENSVAQPSIENMVALAKYFQVSVEDILAIDFSALTDRDWAERTSVERQRISGAKLRILSTIVNQNNEEVVELIPDKARAGYTAGYADPSYLEDCPTLNLPYLSKNKKYRAFSVSGDSMPPVVDGSIVVGEFLSDWMQIRSGEPYIIITHEDGIVFKRVFHYVENPGYLQLVSSNPLFDPYQISFTDVIEIWGFVSYISTEIPDVKIDDATMLESLLVLQKDVKRLLERK